MLALVLVLCSLSNPFDWLCVCVCVFLCVMCFTLLGLADLQIVGFGLLSTYHANNEYCLLSGMQGGFATLAYTIVALNAPTAE